jgi:hypothetical protein
LFAFGWRFLFLETGSEEPLNPKSEQYRFARIEGYRITLMRLENQFKDRAVNIEEMEAAVFEQLARENLCAPWRRTDVERAGCRDGMRIAAAQFLSQYREAVRIFTLAAPDEPSVSAYCRQHGLARVGTRRT